MINLKDIRKTKNITQRVLAEEIGVTKQYVYCLEKQKRTPSIKTAKKIADVLGFDWQRFYEEESMRAQTDKS